MTRRSYYSPAAARGAAIAGAIITFGFLITLVLCCGGALWISGSVPGQPDHPHTPQETR